MIWSGSHWRLGVITNGWPRFIVCNTTWCLLLQLIILFRFSGRTAEDQIMTKCTGIKFLTLEPMPTSTPSFQQLYACRTLHLHLWSIVIQFSPLKQASLIITNTDSRDHRPQCVILGSSRDALYWKMQISQNSAQISTRLTVKSKLPCYYRPYHTISPIMTYTWHHNTDTQVWYFRNSLIDQKCWNKQNMPRV